MKFNISLKVLPLLACGMLMASCNDFLKQEPLTDITPTDYYKDATQLQAVANAFYQTVLPYHSGAGYGKPKFADWKREAVNYKITAVRYWEGLSQFLPEQFRYL